MGVSISVLYDGCDVGVRPQELNVSIGEASSETIDDVPFVRDIGIGTKRAGNGPGDTRKSVSVGLIGHNITPGNGVLGPPDEGMGGRSGESWENKKKEWEELLGEHGGSELQSWDLKHISYLSDFCHLKSSTIVC